MHNDIFRFSFLCSLWMWLTFIMLIIFVLIGNVWTDTSVRKNEHFSFFFLHAWRYYTCVIEKKKKKYAKGERDIEKGALVKVFSHSMPSLFFTLKNGFLNLRFGCDADNRRYINIDFQLFLVSKFYCRFLFTVELWAGIVFGEKRFLKNWFTYVCMCEREMRGL